MCIRDRVKTKPASPVFTVTHQKTLTADGAKSFIMTFNLEPGYFATTRDFGILTTNQSEIQEIIRREESADDGADDATPIVEPGTAGMPSAPKRKPGRPATRRSSQVAAVESQLRQALGVKVVVHANGKGAGRIVIPFTDLDEFQRLLDHITE